MKMRDTLVPRQFGTAVRRPLRAVERCAYCYSPRGPMALLFCCFLAVPSCDAWGALSSDTGEIPAQASLENYCGGQALQVACALLGRTLTSSELHVVLPPDGQPTSLANLERAAKQLSLHTESVHWESDQEPHFPVPAIVRTPVGPNDTFHYVVISGRVGPNVQILDFPYPPRLAPINEFKRRWDGVALYVAADADALGSIRRTNRWLAVFGSVAIGCVVGLATWFVFSRFIQRASSSPGSEEVESSTPGQIAIRSTSSKLI